MNKKFNDVADIPKLFKATDKLGKTFTYRFIGIFPSQTGFDYIHLWNETWNEETDVELEWFNQRKIELIEET